MTTEGLVWIGTATNRYEETVRFFRDLLRGEVAFEAENTTELGFRNGSRVQVFAPGHPYHAWLRERQGLLPLLAVEHVDAVRHELPAHGITVVGDLERDSDWEWINVEAPDGHLYELGSRRG